MVKLRQRGLSLRRIAELLGVHHDTIREDLSGVGNPTPENQPVATGADGKTYPARQRTEAERQELVLKLRQKGWSTTRIAEKIGVSPETVRLDISTSKKLEVENPPEVLSKDGRIRPARQRTEAERHELVRKLRQRGLSLPRIAGMLGVDTKTVYNDLNSGLEFSKPERPSESTGADGKTYPARQRTEAERM